MNRNIIALFNGCFLDIQRRVAVVVETMNDVSVLGCCNRADQEAHDEKPDNHECRSGSAIKYRLKINNFVFYSLHGILAKIEAKRNLAQRLHRLQTCNQKK